MEEVDKAIAVYKPDRWKGYTIGDPLCPSKFPWRLDDEKLMYPFYEKAVKAGINTICIHKGLLPADYEKSFAGVWEYATAWDVGKAAKDWPQMNFVIYHSALRAVPGAAGAGLGRVREDRPHQLGDRSRRDPAKFGVNNVYGEIGTVVRQFRRGASEVLRRRLIGTLVKGLGRRPRALGHRLGVVRLAAVADRGDAAARDPRGHAEEARLRAARRSPTAR